MKKEKNLSQKTLCYPRIFYKELLGELEILSLIGANNIKKNKAMMEIIVSPETENIVIERFGKPKK